jgi:hypothetical protein
MQRYRVWLVELEKFSNKKWDIPLYLTYRWSFVRFRLTNVKLFNSKKEAEDAVRSRHLRGAPQHRLRIRQLELDYDRGTAKWINPQRVSVRYVGEPVTFIDYGFDFYR